MWIVLAALFLIVKKTRKEGVTLAIGLILHVIVCNVLLKNIVARPRPYTEVEGLVSLIGKLSDYSFPSGHTVAGRGPMVAEMRFCLCFCRSRPSATGTGVWRPRGCSLKSWLGGQPMGDGQAHHIQTVFPTHSSWDKEAARGCVRNAVQTPVPAQPLQAALSFTARTKASCPGGWLQATARP